LLVLEIENRRFGEALPHQLVGADFQFLARRPGQPSGDAFPVQLHARL
jgi:hypothetical protein